MKGRGFSIVELVIVITVIGILAAIGVARFSQTQQNARDTERRTKAENIARYLESMYSHGNAAPPVEAGTYPRVSVIADSCNTGCTADSTANPWPINIVKLEALFGNDGFDSKNLKAPGATGYSIAVARTATAQTPALNTFIYQPLALNSSDTYVLCNLPSSECRAFNLYYRSEVDNTIQKITSKKR